MIFNGLKGSNGLILAKGIGLLLYGVLVISLVDNIIRGFIHGREGTVHPLTVVIGILGGIPLFGIIGLFMGPVILSLAIVFVRDFAEVYQD